MGEKKTPFVHARDSLEATVGSRCFYTCQNAMYSPRYWTYVKPQVHIITSPSTLSNIALKYLGSSSTLEKQMEYIHVQHIKMGVGRVVHEQCNGFTLIVCSVYSYRD